MGSEGRGFPQTHESNHSGVITIQIDGAHKELPLFWFDPRQQFLVILKALIMTNPLVWHTMGLFQELKKLFSSGKTGSRCLYAYLLLNCSLVLPDRAYLRDNNNNSNLADKNIKNCVCLALWEWINQFPMVIHHLSYLPFYYTILSFCCVQHYNNVVYTSKSRTHSNTFFASHYVTGINPTTAKVVVHGHLCGGTSVAFDILATL